MKGPELDDFVADINMTPFVDIVLVLLIIFMISAPLLESRMDVNLPVAKTKDVLPSSPKQFEVCVIHKNGNIEFLKQKFGSMDGFQKFLKDQPLGASIPIFIRADESTVYGVVSQVLASLKNKGVQHVSLVTRDK